MRFRHAHPRSHHHRRAFTLTEAIAVLACLAILAAIFVPYAMHVRERNARATCADHLRQVQAALRLYGDANHNDFPRVRPRVERPDGYVAFTGSDRSDAEPFAPDSAVKPNDVTASLYLLVRAGLVKPAAFVCPSTSDAPMTGDAAALKRRGNFTGPSSLSYSCATPFSGLDDYHLNSDRLRAEFVVLADRNPGGDAVASTPRAAPAGDLVRANSRNHGGAGQNVLYGAGNVEFHVTPYCGFGQDNIYTALAQTPVPAGQTPAPDATGVIGPDVGPAWYADSYLVPTDADGH